MVGVNRGWVYMVVGAHRGQNAFKAMAKYCEAQAKHRQRACRTTTTTKATTKTTATNQPPCKAGSGGEGGFKLVEPKIRKGEQSKR